MEEFPLSVVSEPSNSAFRHGSKRAVLQRYQKYVENAIRPNKKAKRFTLREKAERAAAEEVEIKLGTQCD